MGMMLPNDLVWVMEKLGFEWPDIDEDEVRKGHPSFYNQPGQVFTRVPSAEMPPIS